MATNMFWSALKRGLYLIITIVVVIAGLLFVIVRGPDVYACYSINKVAKSPVLLTELRDYINQIRDNYLFSEVKGHLSLSYIDEKLINNLIVQQPDWNSIDLDSRSTGRPYIVFSDINNKFDISSWSQAAFAIVGIDNGHAIVISLQGDEYSNERRQKYTSLVSRGVYSVCIPSKQ